MPGKSKSRNWNDVQMAIAAVTIVSTLGLWNLFATPARAKAEQPAAPPSPATEPPVASLPAEMPQVKIIFTQTAAQPSIVQPVQQSTQKKKNKNKNNDGGTVSITQTKTS